MEVAKERLVWHLTAGDVNAIDHGGTYTKIHDDKWIAWFKIVVDDEGNRYAFQGDFWIDDIKDFKEDLDKFREEGYIEGNEETEELLCELLDNYGYGVFEFSPSNIHGTGCYSLDYKDFMVTEEELRTYMTEIGIEE